MRAATVVLGLVLLADVTHAETDLHDPAIVQHNDAGFQGALERFQPVLGTPFLAIRAALVVPGAAIAELGNGMLWLVDRPAPGTFPHAERGWMWNGALRSLRDDWSESTPGP